MIDFNLPILSTAQYQQRVGNIGRLFLFDGVPPTVADVKYALYTTFEIRISASFPGAIGANKFKNWAIGRGNNYLGSSNVDTGVVRSRLDEYFANFPLSRNTQSFVELVDGATPTWFIYMVANTTGWANSSTDNHIHHSILGTVGAEGSGADMIIPGGVIDANSTLKTNDILVEEF